MKIPAAQYANWAERMLRGEHLEEEMQNAGVIPNANSPPPATNATLHILVAEPGYGTPDREFVMACGVRWKARESTGEHKYFFDGEPHFFKHVNCDGCRRAFGLNVR